MNAFMNLLNTNVLREIGTPGRPMSSVSHFTGHCRFVICCSTYTCGGGNVSKIEGLENMQIFTVYHY